MTATRLVVGVACPNGIGHFRRLCAMLEALQEIAPWVRTQLVCDTRQLKRLEGCPVLERLMRRPGFCAHRDVLTPGVTWHTDPAVYDDGRLLAWIDRLAALPAIAEADLILSDNLGGVLEHRRDAVLAGSFLWSDVLEAAHPHSAPVRSFVRRERRLLERHRPPMLAVTDIAMPGVARRTRMIGVGWPCAQPPACRRRSPGLIGVAGGATGQADALLIEIAAALSCGERGVVAEVDVGGRSGPRLKVIRPLPYEELDVVVCRPGVGTLTECVRHEIPAVAVYESNAEMEHNAHRLVELGIGRDLGAADPSDVRAAVDRLLAEPREARAQSFARIRRSGVSEAARWLARRLYAG